MTTNQIGLDKEKSNRTIEKLQKLLSDYQIHYQNLRGFHWNVKGSSFFTLHAAFEGYYNEAAARVDEIAERILMLGGTPLHTYADYIDKSDLVVYQNVSDGRKCVEDIVKDVLYLIKEQRNVLETASEAGDEVTVDQMIGYNGSDEKKIWMLNAYLA